MADTFACDMTVIPADLRGVHHMLISHLMTEAVQEVIELPNGFAFRFPETAYDAVTEFVGRERLCCTFLTFSIEVVHGRGPLTLTLTGADGIKDVLRAELGLPR